MMTEPEHILLVEDDSGLRELLQEELEVEGYSVRGVGSVEKARDVLGQWLPDLVVSDLRLPGEDGLGLLPALQALAPSPGLLIITAFGSVQQAVEALKIGADDFLTKPLEMDHFLLTVARLLETRRLRGEVQRYRSLLEEETFHGMLGQSPAMIQLHHQIRQIAQAEGPVLIQGESGTGKELVARALHEESARKDGPYLAVNCGGIPGELMESEFFGHAAGAFTGANRSRAGLFQQADGGTLLLDEIGELPLALQAKLLRALQGGNIRPVGSDREISVDVRVIAASNRDLAQRVQEEAFREDLFFRLETFALQVPPLRERGGDLERLADYFLTRFAARKQRRVHGFSDAAIAALRHYPFPGNVRELQNAVERGVTFCETGLVEPEHLPQRIVDQAGGGLPEAVNGFGDPAGADVDENVLPSLEQVQRQYVEKVLKATAGNKRRAAEILGITRRTLYRWLDQESG